MRAIFISYRRDDTEGQAGRLFQQLRESFGADVVFMDVATIEPGVDFREAIEKNTAACGVLLALIGRDWVSLTDAEGHRRLDNPDDFVRLETASALCRGIPVIPVLVQGARMPRADELPADLKDLAYRNSVELTHARWDSDVALLVKALRPFTQVKRPHPFSTRLAAGAVFALALAVGGWALYGRQTALPRTDTAEADAAALAASRVKAQATARAAAQAKADAEARARADADARATAAALALQQAVADKAAADRLAAEKAAADNTAEADAAALAASRVKVQATARAAAQARTDAEARARADADARATAAALALQQAAADQAAADKLAAEKAAADNAAAANATQVQAHRDGICITGFVWREAGPGDKVCVTPQLRAQAGAENRTAIANRQPGGGPYGPNTCREGFVWREAVANDVICVVPGSRRQAVADNAAAASRVVPLPQTIRR